jgi:small-conductance mechanosensitive channel
MNRIKRAMERSASRAECSPSVLLLALIAVIVVMGYHYINLVIKAAVLTAGTAGALTVMIGMALLARTLVHAKRGARPTTTLPAAVAETPQDAIAIEADMLADDQVQLTVGRDGKILQRTSVKE